MPKQTWVVLSVVPGFYKAIGLKRSQTSEPLLASRDGISRGRSIAAWIFLYSESAWNTRASCFSFLLLTCIWNDATDVTQLLGTTGAAASLCWVGRDCVPGCGSCAMWLHT